MVFFDYFVKSIAKKSLWASRVSQAKIETDICSVSDEAFALLVYENNIDRWTDIYSKDPNALLPRLGAGKRRSYCESLVPTKYTRGGIQYSGDQDKPCRGYNGKGWSNEGITRFNVLYGKVLHDRKDNSGFFDRYVAYYKQKIDKEKPPARKKIGETVVLARHNLFGESDDDTEDEEVGAKEDEITAEFNTLVNDGDESSDEDEDDI